MGNQLLPEHEGSKPSNVPKSAKNPKLNPVSYSAAGVPNYGRGPLSVSGLQLTFTIENILSVTLKYSTEH
jgi:hypothetical protein